MLRLLRTMQLLLPMSAARMMAWEAPAMPDIEEYRDIPIRAYNVRRRCRPLWQAIAARTTTSERQLVLLPTSFCIEYSFNCIPMLEALTDPRNALTLALLLPLGLLLVATLRSARLD